MVPPAPRECNPPAHRANATRPRASHCVKGGFKEWVDGGPVCEVGADRWEEGEGKGGV